MQLTRAQKKAKLQAAAEALIEQLLSWDEQNQAPNMTQIEDEVLQLRQRFGQEMAGVVLEGQVAREPVETLLCVKCGKPLRYKGRKGKDIESRLGGMTVERGAYYCKNCASSFFPPRPAT
jgi:uncharacterized protein YhaN